MCLKYHLRKRFPNSQEKSNTFCQERRQGTTDWCQCDRQKSSQVCADMIKIKHVEICRNLYLFHEWPLPSNNCMFAKFTSKKQVFSNGRLRISSVQNLKKIFTSCPYIFKFYSMHQSDYFFKCCSEFHPFILW